MARKRKPSDVAALLPHESGIRSLIAQSAGEEHIAHTSLAEAKADPDGVVILEGDEGGQIYAVARAAFVCCSEAQLRHLLSELDAIGWADPESARLFFESLPIGSGVPGGTGGGAVTSELWIHPNLRQYEAAIRNVFLDQQASIHQ